MAAQAQAKKVLRIGIIQDGRKIAEGTTAELLHDGESLEAAFLRLTAGDETEQIR